MLTLSKHRRDRLRELGVEPDLPRVKTYQSSNGETHLAPECGEPVGEVTVLDLPPGPQTWCHRCDARPGDPALPRAASELHELDGLLEEVGLLELTVEFNSTRVGVNGPSVNGLSQVLVGSRNLLEGRLKQLEERTYTSRAASTLVERTREAANAAIAVLATPTGQRAVDEALSRQWGRWDESGDAVLLEVWGLDGLGLTAAAAYGKPTGPGRMLVRGPRAALTYLSTNSVSVSVWAEGVPDEVLQTAAALWEPGSTGPLGRGSTLLEAASELTPVTK